MTVNGPSPVGRYGHAVTMAGSKFVVFGGQVDGEFLNDLWSFDLNSRMWYFLPTFQCSSGGPLAVRSKAVWEFLEPLGGEIPARRTGHVCVTYGERIIMYVFNFYECLLIVMLMSTFKLWRNRRPISL